MNIHTRLPQIDHHTKIGLEQRIEEITKTLNPEKKENSRFGNPLIEHKELSGIDKYTDTRNKAIILAKIDRELKNLVNKYN